MLIIGKSLPDIIINAMSRSIPSIIVLSLMCFTISYGLVRFPDAGILDAAPARIVVTDPLPDRQTSISLKPLADGSELQQDEESSSTVLEEPQATSEDLFVLDSPTPPAAEAVDTASNNDASENAANKAPENKKKKSNKGSGKAKENKKPDTASVSTADAADKAEGAPNTTESQEPELPKLESEPETNSAEGDSVTLIGMPDNDKAAQDGSLPIESELDPFPLTDTMDSVVPPIVVDNNPPESVPEPLMADEQTAQDEFSIPGMTPETEESVNKFWEDRLNENAPSNEASSSKDNSSTDTANSSPAEKTPKTPEPTVIQTDPNAQEIPPRNRETKPANKDALTLPALDEPQNVNPNGNQSNTGTIPLESFPLDASAVKKVNYTEVCQEEPYDTLGFDIPETGPIVVKRLPSVDNSVDPIYNNAQLDRFAL